MNYRILFLLSSLGLGACSNVPTGFKNADYVSPGYWERMSCSELEASYSSELGDEEEYIVEEDRLIKKKGMREQKWTFGVRGLEKELTKYDIELKKNNRQLRVIKGNQYSMIRMGKIKQCDYFSSIAINTLYGT
jgi:hypothetical protein